MCEREAERLTAALAIGDDPSTVDWRAAYHLLHNAAWDYAKSISRADALASQDADSRETLDVDRARLVFHNEYENDYGRIGYSRCQHRNQHRSTWDCQKRVDEFVAEYAALRSPDTETAENPYVGITNYPTPGDTETAEHTANDPHTRA